MEQLLVQDAVLTDGKVKHGGVMAGASLVAEWLRIRPAIQGSPVQSVVREDLTKPGASPAEPRRCKY